MAHGPLNHYFVIANYEVFYKCNYIIIRDRQNNLSGQYLLHMPINHFIFPVVLSFVHEKMDKGIYLANVDVII